jgi:hypothetical protein
MIKGDFLISYSAMEILAKLFGSETRVKLIRLFLFNAEVYFTLDEVIGRTRSDKKSVKKEITSILGLGIVKKRSIVREVSIKKGKKIVTKKIQDTGYHLDSKFPYLQALKNLLIIVSLHADDSLVKKFASVGRIKLFIASGVFMQVWDTRVDLLIVGDDLNLTKLEAVLKSIESEIGKELSYSVFETEDFEYRYGMHDRLIRDIMDLPHTTLVDKLGLDSNKVV